MKKVIFSFLLLPARLRLLNSAVKIFCVGNIKNDFILSSQLIREISVRVLFVQFMYSASSVASLAASSPLSTPSGKIRVGRRLGTKDPKLDGYKPIVCLTKSTPYGELGPYELKDEDGVIMENYYQFSKVYTKVSKSVQRYSQYDQSVIWNHPAEIHVDEKGYLTKEWFEWAIKGMKNKYAIRYPVGRQNRGKCLGAVPPRYLEQLLKMKGGYPRIHLSQLLSYVEARQQIYFTKYHELVIRMPK